MMRTALAAAVTVLLAGTAQAATTEFIIFKQNNFRGPSQTIKGQVDNLEGGFAREGSSLIVRGGYWEVCNRDHFKGDCYVLGPGEYPSLSPALDDRIVAVRFLGADKKHAARVAKEERREAREERRDDRREARQERREDRREARRDGRIAPGAVELYSLTDFKGPAVRVQDNVPTLSGFDGQPSSVFVHSGTWELCSRAGYEGRCETFEPGRYARLERLNDRVSSLRQVR